MSKTYERLVQQEWDRYENALKTMDWYYEMSDDHGVWSKGRERMSEICQMRERMSGLDEDKALAMWNKHCPRGGI